jgi:cytochrome c6
VLALTGYETALLVVAIAFIVFALIAALVIPRSRPAFPGNRLGLFIAICGVFFVAQMTAVLVLAEVGEADEPAHEEAAGGEEPPPGEPPPGEPAGDAAAGQEVFLGDAACGSCHTLADAGTTGKVGPNLDEAKPSYERAVMMVRDGGGGGLGVMPKFEGTLTPEQIDAVARYVSDAAGAG